MFGINFINVVIALIISFNIARPQTKRKNVVEDLKSQARGSVYVCFAYFIFWILAYITYIRNPESESLDFYCYFIVILGWYGIFVLFIGYGLLSKRFRNGLRGEKAIMAKYTVHEDTTSINTVTTRPTSISEVSETKSESIDESQENAEIPTGESQTEIQNEGENLENPEIPEGVEEVENSSE